MIDVKATKPDTPESSAQDRYILKTGSVFSNVPVYFMLIVAGLIAYLRDVFPALSSDDEEEDEKTSPPLDEEAAELEAEEIEETGSVPEKPAKHVGSSGLVATDADEDSVVVVASPPSPFRPGEIAVSTDNGLFNFRTRANNDNVGTSRVEIGDTVGFVPDDNGGNTGPGGGFGGEDDGNDDDLPSPLNRAPRSAGPVSLGDFVSGHAVVLTFASLLQNAADPDADHLTIVNLTASAGTLTPVKGGWLFTPEEGEPGFVTLSYALSDGTVEVRHEAILRVVLHHTIEGSAAGDTLLGTNHVDHIDGLDGDDAIDAREGNDVIAGGNGNDQVVGGDGNDTIFGGDGDDLIFAGLGDDYVSGGPGNDRIFGGPGDDTIDGGDDNDTIHGDEGNDLLAGGHGNDEIHGGDGADTLLGQAGNDFLTGGIGNDVLDGGPGRDDVRGGAGDDTIITAIDSADDSYDGGEGSDALDMSATKLGVLVDLTTGKAVGVEIGNNTISGFEAIIGGDGDDTFIIGATPVSVRGGDGRDDFKFSAVALTAGAQPAEHSIHDFMFEDRIHVGDYEISKRAARDVEDLFQDIYGEAATHDHERSIRYRNERVEEMERTKIEADLDGDALYELAINLDGHHILFIAENIG